MLTPPSQYPHESKLLEDTQGPRLRDETTKSPRFPWRPRRPVLLSRTCRALWRRCSCSSFRFFVVCVSAVCMVRLLFQTHSSRHFVVRRETKKRRVTFARDVHRILFVLISTIALTTRCHRTSRAICCCPSF